MRQEYFADYKEQKFGIKRMFGWDDAHKKQEVATGDCFELRDFSSFVPEDSQTEKGVPGADGKWGLTEYRLIDGTHGNMLYVNYKTKDVYHFTDKGMPPVLEIKIPLQGRYAIWAGVPVINLDDLRMGGAIAGIDLALDDEVFTLVRPAFGTRYGRFLGETGREYLMFWKNADLNQSTLKIRVMFGTYSAQSLGQVSAILSCLRFIKLSDNEPLEAVKGKPDKDFMVIVDGFSHYAIYGLLGECMDLRLNRAYENSDVRMIMWQTMSPTMWKSKVNSYLGEGATEKDYEGKRAADRRVIEYARKSIELEQEALRVQTEDCHKNGMEMHYSIRANLHFPEGTKYMKGNDILNGSWWHEHPECRLPESVNLDYGKKEVRQFFLDMFREALELFDIDGINLDLTRWPKVLDPKYHSMDLLVDFCREMRALADNFGEKRGKHIKVSLAMVEYYHSYCSLEEQAIDFDAIVQSHTLDFICLQAFRQEEYAKKAHEHGVKLYSAIDDVSPYSNMGQFRDKNNYDLLWHQPDGTMVGDPAAGEELREFHPIVSKPAPIEQYRMMARFYDEGNDGIAMINDYFGTLHFRDCGHSDMVRKHAENGTVYGQEIGEYIFTF